MPRPKVADFKNKPAKIPHLQIWDTEGFEKMDSGQTWLPMLAVSFSSCMIPSCAKWVQTMASTHRAWADGVR